MRSLGLFLTVLASFLTTTVAALTTKDGVFLATAEETALQDLRIIDMTVTDDRFPGHVFSGTAASVVAEMSALKPELFKDMIIDDTLLSLDASSTSPATDAPQKRLCCGEVNCKTYYSGKQHRIPWGWCVGGVTHLKELDRAMCTVAGAPACARTDTPVSVRCGDIAKDVNKIGNTCKDGGVWGARDFDSHYTGVRRQEC